MFNIINILNRQNGDQNKIFKILSGKGIFSYEITDSVEQLKYNEEQSNKTCNIIA